MEVTIIPMIIGAHSTVTIGLVKGLVTGGDCPNYSIVEMGQNTEKSPGDLRRLVVTQTLGKNHLLTLV